MDIITNINTTAKMGAKKIYIEPLSAVKIRDQVVRGSRSIKALAQDYSINPKYLIEKPNHDQLDKNVFGLNTLEKLFIIKIYKITRLSSEDLYESLKDFFPGLSIGGINDCIQQSRKYKL